MKKGKALRLGGFVVAACTTVALAAVAAQSTGAWFSDSQGGTLNASSGQLQLKINYGSGYTDDHNNIDLNYNDLMPGTNVQKHIPYQVGVSSGSVDLWLVFDTTGSETLPDSPTDPSVTKTGSPYQLFTGGGNAGTDNNGLGRYGFFEVDDTHGGPAFVSGNLKFPDSTNTPGMPGTCPTSVTTGRGGSAVVSDGTTYPPYCGVPSRILLASGLTNNETGTVTITFGLNGPLQTWQGQPEPSVPYHLVAVQSGQTP